MRRYVGILAVGALLALGGCQTALNVLSGGVANPLTPSRALVLHASFDAGVVVAAGNYAALPRCPAPAPCSDQKVVNQLRVYVNTAERVLSQLDDWAQGNPKLDGPALFSAAIGAVSAAQEYATQNGMHFIPASGT